VEPAGAPGRIARNAGARIAGEALAKVGSLAFFIVLARHVGEEGFGVFSFALALTGALLIAAGFGTDDLLAREVSRDKRRAGHYLGDAVGLKIFTSIALLAVALAVVTIGDYPTEARWVTLLVGAGVAMEVMSRSWHSVFQAHERLGLVSSCLIVQRLVTAAGGITILLAGGGLVAASAMFAVGALVALTTAEVMLRRAIGVRRSFPTRAGAMRLLHAGVPIGIAGVLFTLLLRLDVTLLSFLSTDAEVGVYAAAFRLVEGIQFVSWAFGAAMLPWFAREQVPALLERGFMLGMKFEAGLLLPVGLVFTLFAPSIVHLLYGDQFAGAVVPLRILGCTVAFYGLQSFAGTVLIARDAPRALLRNVAIVCTQNVVCNAIFIPLAGANGAAAVTLSSSVLLATLAVTQGSRRCGGLMALRSFLGPLLAAVSMALVGLAVPLPAIPAGAIALLTYAGVFIAFEQILFPEDLRSYLRALPRLGRARLLVR
jgi:O-antigen/teichoic acid export membrane protein